MAENENKNIILTDIEIMETNELVQIDETIQVIEFDDVNTYEIHTDNAFAALGEPNAQLRHSLLTNREDPNQHPIIAIEGLREELDSIEALQVVYSDKKQQADYYMWHDENLAGDNRVGYFVSMHKATEHDTLHGTLCCIEICDGTQDIFGVTVSEAGFIGGQEYAQATDGTKVGRNHKYGLVVHSGLVGVQCESDVAVGDYVAPNSRGIAAKTDGKYGYLVTTMSDINGIMHAIISLIPSSVIAQTVADNLDNLGERMTSAEYNITSVTNVANSAYSLAIDAKENAEVNSEYLEEKITEVLGRMDAVDSVVGILGESVNNASAEAAMARTIADGAVSSANAIKDEAVSKANEAFVEVANTRKDLEGQIVVINKELNDTVSDLTELTKDLEPLATWPDAENPTGIAGFVARANENAATLASITKFEGEFGEAITGFVQEATKENATVKAIASYQQKDEDGNPYGPSGASVLMGLVDANKASIDALASLEGEGFAGLAGLTAQVNQNTSSVAALASHIVGEFENTDDWVEDEKDINKVYYAKNRRLYYYYSPENEKWHGTPNAYEAGLTGSVATVQQKADNNSARIQSIADWQGTTNESMARIEQKADENGAKIEAIVSNIDKYAVGEYSQAYGLTHEQAKTILPTSVVYAPTLNHQETYDAYTQEFLKGYYYTWSGEIWEASESVSVAFSNVYMSGTTGFYWVVTDQDVEVKNAEGEVVETYDLGSLYLYRDDAWVKVASVVDNTLSRAVSLIKQTTDSIKAEVVNVKGDVSALDIRVGANETSLQTLTTWQGETTQKMTTIEQKTNDNESSIALVVVEKDGENIINAASITTAIVDDESSIGLLADNITLDADQINFTAEDYSVIADNITLDGYVKFTNLSTSGETIIDGANIKTSTVEADKLNVDQLSAIAANLGTVHSGNIQSPGYMEPIIWGEADVGHASSGLEIENNVILGIGTCTDTDIVIPKSVTTISNGAFKNNTTISSVIIPDSVIRIEGDAFLGCTQLKKVTIGKSVTSIGVNAFDGCEKLEELFFNANECKEIGNNRSPFTVCGSASEGFRVTFGENVTQIPAYLFRAYMGGNTVVPAHIKEVVIPNSVTSVGSEAFLGCSSLTTVYYKGDATAWGQISIGGSNSELTNATRYYYSAKTPTTSGNYWCYEDGFKISCSGDYMIDSKNFKVTQSGEVTVTAGSIQSTDYDSDLIAVWGATDSDDELAELVPSEGLTYTINSDNVTCTITGIGSCQDRTLVIPETIDGYTVTAIADKAFYSLLTSLLGLNRITSVVIPDSVTSLGSSAFEGCYSLTSVVIGKNVAEIGSEAFAQCHRLVEVINKSSHITVTKGATSHGRVGEYAEFVYNSDDKFVGTNLTITKDGLVTYQTSDGVVLAGYIGDKATITIPGTVTKIRMAACILTPLKSVVIPNSVTLIDTSAFAHCYSLTSVIIGYKVTSIGDSAFNRCRSLKKVCYQGNSEDWNQITIGSSNEYLTNATRYYYSATAPTDDGNYWHYASSGFKLSCDDAYMIQSPNFTVTQEGRIFATDVDLRGKVEVQTGRIGDWEITDGKLQSSDGAIGLNNSTQTNGRVFWATDNFKVTNDGTLTAKCAEFGAENSYWKIYANTTFKDANNTEIYTGPALYGDTNRSINGVQTDCYITPQGLYFDFRGYDGSGASYLWNISWVELMNKINKISVLESNITTLTDAIVALRKRMDVVEGELGI